MNDEIMYEVYDDQEQLVMKAPLRTIRRAFNLHQSAVARIEAGCDKAEDVLLHFNHRRHSITGDSKFITVTL